MLKKTVVIGSEEFNKSVEETVLKIIKKSHLVINEIENPRFERLFDGWIKDNELGIDWGLSSASSMTFSNAEAHCKSVGGRLPSVDELFSLVDRSVHSPSCDKNAFKDMKSEYYWTSEKYVTSNNCRWVVGFNSGLVGYSSEDGNGYVRPVRPSQC